jgi:hypothetical protein
MNRFGLDKTTPVCCVPGLVANGQILYTAFCGLYACATYQCKRARSYGPGPSR